MDKTGNTLTGGEVVEELLYRNKVDTVFCITGAGNLAIIDAIERRGRIRTVYSHHEQAAVMEANGYSRIRGTPGVAIVTTGGGTSNAVTGILSAHLDSVPVMVISGNESSFNCRRMMDFRAFGVQGFDSVSVTRPICKASIQVTEPVRIIHEFHELWTEMTNGRQGPVHLDVPMDVQRQSVPIDAESWQFVPPRKQHFDNVYQIRTQSCAESVRRAAKPLFYFGNGIRDAVVQTDLLSQLSKLQIPYLVSWSALDLFPTEDPLNVGRAGIYGDQVANIVLQQCDVLVTVGTRLAIPQVGYDLDDFARKAEKFVVDVDATELTKFAGFGWTTLNVSALEFLKLFFREYGEPQISREAWVARIAHIRQKLPQQDQIGPRSLLRDEGSVVHSFDVVKAVSRNMPANSTIVTDVGAGLLTGHFAVEVSGSERVFTSQGLGEMGFGLPGAIGAYFGDSTRPIICLNTDGGIMFNLQELEVVRYHKIPMKLFVFNNNGYTMIRVSQENLFDGRQAGVSPQSGISFPNFRAIAAAFDLNFSRIDDSSLLDDVCGRVLTSNLAELVEVVMSPKQRYLPRLATSKGLGGSLISPPIEDLDPKIPLQLLQDLLGYEPHQNSRQARIAASWNP